MTAVVLDWHGELPTYFKGHKLTPDCSGWYGGREPAITLHVALLRDGRFYFVYWNVPEQKYHWMEVAEVQARLAIRVGLGGSEESWFDAFLPSYERPYEDGTVEGRPHPVVFDRSGANNPD